MANTFTQLYIQIVFSVKNRQKCIPPQHREEVQKYISGIISHLDQKLLAIYCMPDHIHILVSLKPTISIADLTARIKANSSRFINSQAWMTHQFQWQNGYGAFSYAHREIDKVIQYVLNQEEHHRKIRFQEEYRQFLERFDIPYNEKYLFDV